MARQIKPRPNLAIKLMASGVIFSAAMVRSPSFSRSSSSTTTIMRPARISSIAVGTSVNAGSVGIKTGVSFKDCSKIAAPCCVQVRMVFKDKNEFEAGDREDEFRTGAFPLESADSESPDEESPDDEEEELSEEELAEETKPFTVAEWKQEFPDYTAEELEEKIPKTPRASRMALLGSCLFGTLLGAAIAGVLVDDQPGSQEARAFFIYFLVLA